VLKRVNLVLGPSRNDFETVVAHVHVPTLEDCSNYDPARLNGIRDELMQKVHVASSLRGLDASLHWCPLDKDDQENPKLTAKKIDVQSILEFVGNHQPVPFRFAPTERMVKIGEVHARISRLEQKMERGGLADQFESMQTRTRSAERYFLELASRKPNEYEKILDQVENFVKGECDDAKLEVSQQGTIYGRAMLTEVTKRLKSAAKERSRMVYNLEPECLIGIAGALTAECKVWWSEKFQIEDAL
jgi:hypothetical protein